MLGFTYTGLAYDKYLKTHKIGLFLKLKSVYTAKSAPSYSSSAFLRFAGSSSVGSFRFAVMLNKKIQYDYMR